MKMIFFLDISNVAMSYDKQKEGQRDGHDM